MNSAEKAYGFFLPGSNGGRYCVFHPPADGDAIRGAFVYIHPFGEELNCSRHIAATQARQLARLGYGVLQIDLTGCGDSCGELRDVTWECWIDDVVNAVDWLMENCSPRISMWGHRVGALIALDSIGRMGLQIEHLFLWQPVINGRLYLTNFLRIALAGRLLTSVESGGAVPENTCAMRAALAAGSVLEIGGYELSGALAAALDEADATKMPLPVGRVHWIDVTADGSTLPPASQRLIESWQTAGVSVDAEIVTGSPFWSSPGHTDAPALLAATRRLLETDRA